MNCIIEYHRFYNMFIIQEILEFYRLQDIYIYIYIYIHIYICVYIAIDKTLKFCCYTVFHVLNIQQTTL